ncbi:MAG: chromosome partitioning protein ParB [Hyphomicrobiales bacterium]|nr:chromosome partitioning protein ParB [Hyphomicrobiales bacterium]
MTVKPETIDPKTIRIGERSRDLDEAWVDALAGIFKTEEMTHPIRVWGNVDSPVLVAGAHRLAAHIRNEAPGIRVTWSSAKNIDEAKLEEVMENIGRNELNALDRARHLYDLKTVYEKLHPETKNGAQGGPAAQKNENAIFAFSIDVGEKIGLSRRSIETAVALWKGLTEASRARVRGTWMASHQANLKQLSDLNPGQQKKVLDLILPAGGKQPQATSVAEALFILSNGRSLSHVEKKFDGLNRTLSKLKDEELDAVLTMQEARVLAWARARLGETS